MNINKPYLIALFNEGHDFARKEKDGSFVGVPKGNATHKLYCTKWNPNIPHIENVKLRLRAEKTRPDGYALAVCAMPLHRRKEPKHLSQKLRAPIAPKGNMPVFNKHGSLNGQRSVLSAMVATHKTPTKMRRLIKTLSADKCYRLYRVLRRASQRAARRLARQQRRTAR